MLQHRAEIIAYSGEESERINTSGDRGVINQDSSRNDIDITRILEDIKTHPCVYQPSDDTELAVKALTILHREGRRYAKIIEVGSGTGVLSLAAFILFKPETAVAIDISPYAVKVTRENLPEEILVARCDGFSCVSGKWDLAILNPPYLPVQPSVSPPRSCEDWLDLAWSGAEVMGRLIEEALSTSREAVIISSSLSLVKPIDVSSKMGCRSRLLAYRQFFFEKIEAYHVECEIENKA